MNIRLWILGGLVGALALHLSSPAWGAEGAKPAVSPPSNNDYWNDEDIWNDWGSPTGSDNKKATADKEGREEPRDDFGAAAGANATAGAGAGFSGSTDKVQFRLVGENSEGPRGVRKVRPSYGQSRKRSL